MTPEQVLAIRPKVLTQKQRENYFCDGYLYVERAISEDWIRRLRAATDELVERSRKVTHSDAIFDLEPAHRPDAPRLRRVSNPVEQHSLFWEYCLNSPLPDIVSLAGLRPRFSSMERIALSSGTRRTSIPGKRWAGKPFGCSSIASTSRMARWWKPTG